MDEKKLQEFNIELKALLIKYNVSLNVGYQINVVENKPEIVAKKTSDEPKQGRN